MFSIPNYDLLFKLQNQLQNFGLNPIDWLIEPHQQNQYLLRNKTDADFILIGQINSKKSQPDADWEKISLYNI